MANISNIVLLWKILSYWLLVYVSNIKFWLKNLCWNTKSIYRPAPVRQCHKTVTTPPTLGELYICLFLFLILIDILVVYVFIVNDLWSSYLSYDCTCQDMTFLNQPKPRSVGNGWMGDLTPLSKRIHIVTENIHIW